MEDLGFVNWSYSEDIDELRQKLEYTTFQLEAVKKKAEEEAIRHSEQLRHLFNLISITCRERDEAREQLQKLLSKFMPFAEPTDLINPILPHVQPAKANSTITESNSLSQSPGFSPVDSFFDTVSSPHVSNINLADSSKYGFISQPNTLHFVATTMTKNNPDSTAATGSGSGGKTLAGDRFVSSSMTWSDPYAVAMDNACKGKPLPEKGKLLQAVMDVGPLLQALLDAGPLPKWKNPPHSLQFFKIPPVPAKKKFRPAIVKPLNSLSTMESQMSSPSTLKFSKVSGLGISTPSNNSIRILTDKRHKFQ